MAKNFKRYVVTVDMYLYAENDYMAQKRSSKIRKLIDNCDHTDSVDVKEIGEQPFGTPNYRKIPTEFNKKDISKKSLPF